MVNSSYRRRAGALLGALLGLVYGAAAHLVNLLALPGIPYYPPPLGPLGNTLLSLAWGTVLGLLVAWPAGLIPGVVAASIAGALAFVYRTVAGLLTAPIASGGVTVTGFLLFLPVALFNVPAMAGFRWAVERQAKAQAEAVPLRARLALPLLLVVVVATAGAFSLLRPEARAVLRSMDRLVQAGRSASGPDDLPPALQTGLVGDFGAHARQPYRLYWTDRDLERFGIPRPANNWENQSVATARFVDGWTLACLFTAPNSEPACRGYSESQ